MKELQLIMQHYYPKRASGKREKKSPALVQLAGLTEAADE
jgi:hypothetical protein